MPINEESVLSIVCDNPACPGNTLDPGDRLGWLFVSSEVYGEPTRQTVFCSFGCVGAASTAYASDVTAPPFGSEPATA